MCKEIAPEITAVFICEGIRDISTIPLIYGSINLVSFSPMFHDTGHAKVNLANLDSKNLITNLLINMR